jgi:hypothetical protein
VCAQGQAEGSTQQNAYQAESPAGPTQDCSTVTGVITEHRLAIMRDENGASRGGDGGGVVIGHWRGQLWDCRGASRGTQRGEVVTGRRIGRVRGVSGSPRDRGGGEVVTKYRPVQLQ